MLYAHNALGFMLFETALAHVDMLVSEFTRCTTCQPHLVAFLETHPHADTETIGDVAIDLWKACTDCKRDYAEYLRNSDCVWHPGHKAETCEPCMDANVAENTCEHGIIGWENCEPCTEAWVAENEPKESPIVDKPSTWEEQNGL